MNKRIKIIYVLTIFGILAFCGLDGYWLYRQYVTYLQEKGGEMYLDVLNTIEDAVKRQSDQNNGDLSGISKIDNVSKGDTTCYSGYVIILTPNSEPSGERIKEITDSVDNGKRPSCVSEIFRFNDVDVSNANTKEFQDAMARALAFRNARLVTDSIEQAVERLIGEECLAKLTEEQPNKLWKSKLFLPENVLHPQMTIVYPYNPIGGGGVEVVVDIPIGATIKQMAILLCVSLGVAMMLITCLILQIMTIRRQQKIADFQKGYTLTMLHELKRPIGALKLFISFMRNMRLSDADRREALENGAKEVDNLASYFEKLRAITYSEAYDAPLTLSTFSLTEAAHDCAANSHANVAVHADGECLVTAEHQSLVNVLVNLVENAVKYSPAGSPIDIDVAKGDASVEFSVADRGKGISDADKARIFDRFYRITESKDVPGIGLGLAYVRQVVSAHGGEVIVTDRDGGGTVFTIKLPQ